MKSEIIDRILSENSEPLHKIIETVKNNAVFQDVMSNIKEEFLSMIAYMEFHITKE